MCELAGESPIGLTLTDAAPLVRQVLVELGVEPAGPQRAPWLLARDTAREMLTGQWSAGSHSLLLLRDAAGSGLEPLDGPLFAWERAWSMTRDEAEMRAADREVAAAVLRLAEERCG